MFCISVSYKKTPLSIRQQFVFSEAEQEQFLFELLDKRKITGGVIVSTCNRSEIYFTAEEVNQVEELLHSFKGIAKEHIRKYCLYYQEKRAVLHLFRVICGLDSMILGEDEILHQVKEAYLLADKGGYTNSELNLVFQGGFHCAKLSKSTTRLSNTPVSIGTLTTNIVSDYRKNIPEEAERNVLVIGATGKIGSIVAKDLMAKGIPVIGTGRKRRCTDGLSLKDDERMEWLDFDRRYDAVAGVGVIVSATSSPHYTLTKEEFLHWAVPGRPYLMIDLAVPRDIDKELNQQDNITLLDIDYFKTLSRENSNIKLSEKEKAESILQECAEEVLKKLYLRNFMEQMEEKFQEKWFRKMIYYLRDTLDSDQLSQVLERIYRNESSCH
ncbi:MAG: glutamyl-tRNA reductase [Lachnospiraceae bacterium]